ncbi:PEP-CTERM sorting domain-containing protein [Paucibacter sp. B2R-40]|uniref:PEP-CTERM sorting domain-containing protein n=1 Tax=Paucibacter sp. B2R-40 TaxID=2893554 RepID=UPI0021E4D7C9|nr:PEP-CTERM sorting domain-containing protein [Paucibacter sp. B2R-40]MCV2356311.1 PEP-CTERM sorting domain-containing protein [Paucibacter sp. B2R-40]
MKHHKLSALAGAMILSLSSAQAASILDTFSDGPGLIQTDAAPYAEIYLPSVEAPGAGRYIANTIAAGVAQTGKFSFAAIQAGAYFTLSDAAIPLYTNLAYGVAHGFGQDLSLDLQSESAFRLDFRYLSAPISLTVTVITAHGGGSPSSVADFAMTVDASFAQTVLIPFAAFVNDAGNPSPVSWGDIDAISFIASGPGGAGFAIDTFSTVQAVPEPASLGLLLAGLGLVARVARRRSI